MLKDVPLWSLLTNSPTNVLTTPRFGLANPAQARVIMANGSEVENPKAVAEMMAPKDPISNVGFLPIASLMRAHCGAIRNSPNVKIETMMPAYVAVLSVPSSLCPGDRNESTITYM